MWAETCLRPAGVGVELLHQVHAVFGGDGPVDDGVPEAHPAQVNRHDSEHAGPLGHDDAAQGPEDARYSGALSDHTLRWS